MGLTIRYAQTAYGTRCRCNKMCVCCLHAQSASPVDIPRAFGESSSKGDIFALLVFVLGKPALEAESALLGYNEFNRDGAPPSIAIFLESQFRDEFRVKTPDKG